MRHASTFHRPSANVILSEAKDPGEILPQRDPLRRAKSAASGFSPETLARLWPNRVHESSWLKNLACHFGWHRWHEMKLEDSQSATPMRFCRWCAKSKIL